MKNVSNAGEPSDFVTKHYVVSDGLSSLSVFVSPLTEDAPTTAVKINSGALNVVTQQKSGHVITVVGEVPESTLKKIVDSMYKK
jgi:sigma-E factor negative regulatory protein RseB